MQNFLSGRKNVSAEKLPANSFKISSDNTDFTKVEVVNAGTELPKVELVTDGGSIKAIIVTCKCGERIELKCHY